MRPRFLIAGNRAVAGRRDPGRTDGVPNEKRDSQVLSIRFVQFHQCSDVDAGVVFPGAGARGPRGLPALAKQAGGGGLEDGGRTEEVRQPAVHTQQGTTQEWPELSATRSAQSSLQKVL